MTRNRLVHHAMLIIKIISMAVVTRAILNSHVDFFGVFAWITVMEVGIANVILHVIVAIWLKTIKFTLYLIAPLILTIPIFLWAEDVVEWQDRSNLERVTMVLNSGLSDSRIREELDGFLLGGRWCWYMFETDSIGNNNVLSFAAPRGFVHEYYFQDSSWTLYD